VETSLSGISPLGAQGMQKAFMRHRGHGKTIDSKSPEWAEGFFSESHPPPLLFFFFLFWCFSFGSGIEPRPLACLQSGLPQIYIPVSPSS
jgi:hypothetical protein